VAGGLASLRGQTAPRNFNAAAAPAAGQASDDMTKKITDLVNAGKYAEAQRLTTGLLVAFPNDERLIKTKSLLDKLLAPAGPTPGNDQPTNEAIPAQVTENTVASSQLASPQQGSIGATLIGADSHGVKLGYVLKDGPADRAGLRPGDVIAAVNETETRNASVLVKVLHSFAPGTTVAISYLRKGGQRQTAATLLDSSALYAKDSTVQDRDTADSYRSLAEQGDADAQAALGGLYAQGKGVSQDSAQAAFWYRKAADQGHATAESALGWLYAQGKGAPEDYVQAVLWCRKAAEQGDANGQSVLGWLYFQGKGVPQDQAQAALWWRKAAEQGYAPAQYNLARLYEYGTGVSQDYAEAAMWYRKAANWGNAGPLTGIEKVDYNALIELGREAQQTTDLDQQKKLLQELMDKSGPFLQKHWHETLVWELRAAAAITLGAPFAGYQAGQELMLEGAADSSEPNVQHLLAQLNLKGWMDKQEAEKQQAARVAATPHAAQSEAEKILAETILTVVYANNVAPANHWKVYGFTAENVILTGQQGNDPRTFRYDTVKTTRVLQKSGSCFVALNGDLLFNKSSGWGNAFVLPWDKSHCSDAQRFANALSTLVKSAVPAR
jgi:TPR repeat protein